MKRGSSKTPVVAREAIKEGVLFKRATKGVVKNWKRRYFVLEGNTLTYKVNEYDDTSKGMVEFDSQAQVLTSDNSNGRFCFVLRGGRVRGVAADVFIGAASVEERKEWMQALAEHIQRAGGSRQPVAVAAAAPAAAAGAGVFKKKGPSAAEQREAATAIQRIFRGARARRHYHAQLRAIIMFQCLRRKAVARQLVDAQLRVLVRPMRITLERVENLCARAHNGNAVAAVLISARPLGELETVITSVCSTPAVRGCSAQWGHGGEIVLLQGCDRNATLVFTVVDTQSTGALKRNTRKAALGQACLHLGALPAREQTGRHTLSLGPCSVEEKGSDAGESCTAVGGGQLRIKVEPVPHYLSRCGYLWKRGEGMLGGGGWKKRWVVLIDTTVSYYSNFGDATPAGEVSVADATMVRQGENSSNNGVDVTEIEVHTPDRVWAFRAPVEDVADWLSAFERAAGLA